MNTIDTIFEFAESFRDKTIFEVLDDCIISAQNLEFATINVKWFEELKLKIESQLRNKNGFRVESYKSNKRAYIFGDLFSK